MAMWAVTAHPLVPASNLQNSSSEPLNIDAENSALARQIASHKVLRQFEKDASIVLIGVRGAGKRSLGFIAATHLGRRFITEGLYFEQVTGTDKATYLRQHGKTSFYHRTLEVLQLMLEQHSENCVIECGMVSLTLEAQTILQQYAQTHPVIHVVRNFDHISQHLEISQQQSKQLKEADSRHQNCSNLEFYNLFDGTGAAETEIRIDDFNSSSPFILQNIKTDFHNYIDLLLNISNTYESSPFSISALPPEAKIRSYVLPVRFSSLLNKNVQWDNMDNGQDAVELCIDLWNPDVATEVGKQVSLLKRQFRVAVILSVFRHPVEGSRQNKIAALEVLSYGLRLQVDYIAINMSLPEDFWKVLIQSKGRTKVIADFHFNKPSSRGWKELDRVSACARIKNQGFDLIRATQPALDRQDNDDLPYFVQSAMQASGLPVIAYNLGYLGRTSQLFNNILSPIQGNRDHPTTSTEPGFECGIPIPEATRALFHCFSYDPLHFHLFGQSVSFSRSPPMYKAAFDFYGMCHNFTYREVSSFAEVLRLAKDPFFGGAAISFPFKEQAFRACSATSLHASVIGSINTFLPLRKLAGDKVASLTEQAKGRNRGGEVIGFYGDNSDWQGVFNNVRKKLSPRNTAGRKRSAGLVIGAGGSARSAIYALLQLECQTIYVYNRTYENAVRVADHFNAWHSTQNPTSDRKPVIAMQPSSQEWPCDAVLPTIIVSCIPTTELFHGQPKRTFELPEEWLGSPSGGVVVDVSIAS